MFKKREVKLIGQFTSYLCNIIKKEFYLTVASSAYVKNKNNTVMLYIHDVLYTVMPCVFLPLLAETYEQYLIYLK